MMATGYLNTISISVDSTSDSSTNNSNYGIYIDSTTGSSTDVTNCYVYSGTSNNIELHGYGQYRAEMEFHGVPTFKDYISGLEPVERKIIDERSWIHRMSSQAKARLKEQAEECAKSLLEELFGYELVENGKYLRVNSKLRFSRKYLIPVKGDMVEVWDWGKQTHKLCAHPSSRFQCPGPDDAIAQKLFLEANEKEFLEIAIRH